MEIEHGLDRIARLPPAPYDKGPTLSGATRIEMVAPELIDAVCRAELAKIPEAGRSGVSIAPERYRYRECYDPWNDVGYIPRYPSKEEQARLIGHMLGHARGGTHDLGNGRGEWRPAAYRSWYQAD